MRVNRTKTARGNASEDTRPHLNQISHDDFETMASVSKELR